MVVRYWLYKSPARVFKDVYCVTMTIDNKVKVMCRVDGINKLIFIESRIDYDLLTIREE